jgi:hypothetical protein
MAPIVIVLLVTPGAFPPEAADAPPGTDDPDDELGEAVLLHAAKTRAAQPATAARTVLRVDFACKETTSFLN